MPHVSLIAFSGLRVRDQAMLELGMQLPGLTDRGAAIAELPALGALTLAGMTPAHWSCDYFTPAAVDDVLVSNVVAKRPDVAAISALTASIDEAYAFADQLRAEGVLVVMGGLHVTACPDEAARHCDAVVIGSGEHHWERMLQDVESGELQPRYHAARSQEIAWAPPRLDLLQGRPPRFTLQTERGCPLACEFCGASRLLGAFQEKPIDAIHQELEAIVQASRTDDSSTSRPMIELADDNTFAGERDPTPLLDALAQSKARWFTEVDWRIGERPDLLEQLAAAGCVQVLVGIESLVFRYPGMRHKQAELDRIMDAVSAIQQAGVVVNGCFIVGAEGETNASLDRLVDFATQSDLAEIQLTLQTPFPGTNLYRRLQADGRLLLDRGWNAYTLFDVTYQPDELTVAELEAGFRRVVQAVFNRDQTMRRNHLRRDVWKRRGKS